MDTMSKPKVVKWFKVYCWILAVLYFVTMLISIPYFVVDPAKLEMDRVFATIIGGMFLVVGFILLIASLLGAFLRPRPWVWVYSLLPGHDQRLLSAHLHPAADLLDPSGDKGLLWQNNPGA